MNSLGLRIDHDTLVRSVSRMLEDFCGRDRQRFFVGHAARFHCLDGISGP
ncbi:MAG: hypothetical protein ACKOD9_02730 [Rubrivivax sp.]